MQDFLNEDAEETSTLRGTLSLKDFIQLFHAEQALVLCNDNIEFYYKLLGRIIHDDTMISDLGKAIEARRWTEALYASHHMKDIFSILKLKKLYEAARNIYEYFEQKCPFDGNFDRPRDELIVLENVDRLMEKLQNEFLLVFRMYEKIQFP